MSLRVAFIGAGQMARHHAAAVRRLGGPARIVGVFDSAAGQAASFAELTASRAFPSADALLSDAGADVVHVCTPPHAHFEPAMAALEGGAHVYVEKPFTLSLDHARQLLDAAGERRRMICAGHQLLHDPAFERLAAAVPRLGAPVQVDSHFAFRPAGLPPARMTADRLADLLVDVLPHPLYALVSLLERSVPGAPIEIAWQHATPADLQAVLRAGDVIGRLSVSLRARPVASTLTFTGTNGALSCDFVRSMIVGAANSGTAPLEKLLNPLVEGTSLVARGTAAIGRRLRSGGYAGLPELIGAFYQAVARGTSSPTPPVHLLTVTSLFEELTASIEHAARGRRTFAARRVAPTRDVVAVTGASGFLGAEICRALPRVRAIVRRPDETHDDTIVADLGRGLDQRALEGVDVVIHAAAATSGGFAEHQRNTIDATRHLLQAMHDARVTKLVLVSSLSVVRPPRSGRERQSETTPRPEDPRIYGAYTWGKCRQEELVEQEAARLGIDVRIVRPGALLDRDDPDLPGLVGRRLFGRWHLGLGRPGLPTAVCDVDTTAAAIAWMATHFDDAPRVVNLLDPSVRSRRDLLALLRTRGWSGRTVWVPIRLLAAAIGAAQTAIALVERRRPDRLAAWPVLRPRRYDATLSARVLEACGRQRTPERREIAAHADMARDSAR